MFTGLSAPARFFLSLFIILSSTIIFMVLCGIIAFLAYDVNIITDPSVLDPSVSSHISLSRLFQIINSIGVFVVPPFIIAYLIYGKDARQFGFRKLPSIFSLVLVVVSAFVVVPVIDYLAYLNSSLELPVFMQGIEDWMRVKEDMATEITMMFLNMNGISDLVLNVVMLAILPALGEELLFRGIFQKIFIDWSRNVHIGIFITAFLFSAFHFQFFSFLPRFMLGMFLGYLFYWSKNIWLPILGHFVNNSAAVISYYFSSEEAREEVLNSSGLNTSLYLVVASSVIFILLNVLIYRKERNLLNI